MILKPHLRAYQQRLRQATNQALSEGGAIALTHVRQEMTSGFSTPIRRSGKLYESLDFRTEDGKLHVGSNLPYAALVHEGTSNMKGRPFLTQGMENAGEEIGEAVCRKVEEV